MIYIMLPLVPVRWAIVDLVPVKIVVVIDVDVAAAPVAIAPPVVCDTCANENPSAKGKPHSRVITRVGIGIVGIDRRTIYDRWIIGWNVNSFRIGLFDHHYGLSLNLLAFYFLLLARLE